MNTYTITRNGQPTGGFITATDHDRALEIFKYTTRLAPVGDTQIGYTPDSNYTTNVDADGGHHYFIDETYRGQHVEYVVTELDDATDTRPDPACGRCGAEWSLECVCEPDTDRDDVDDIMMDDDTIAALFDCLIWQSTDDLDGLGYTRDDISREDQETILSGFRDFLAANQADIDAYMFHTGRTMPDIAHDYILTANRHGTGFWDRCYCGIDRSDAPAQRLTDMAHGYGEIDLYRDDEGTLRLN